MAATVAIVYLGAGALGDLNAEWCWYIVNKPHGMKWEYGEREKE